MQFLPRCPLCTQVSLWSKIFVFLILSQAVAIVAFTTSVLLRLDKGSTPCRDPPEDHCFDSRNAAAFAVPPLMWAVALVCLVSDAIAAENSVQLIITLMAHCILLVLILCENTILIACSGGGKIDSCRYRHKGVETLLYGIWGDWPPSPASLALVNGGLMLVGLLCIASASRVHLAFGWRSFRVVSNDPNAHRALRAFFVLQTALRIELFALSSLLVSGNMLSLQWPRSRLEWNLVLLVTGAGWQVFVHWVLRRKQWWLPAVVYTSGVLLPAYILLKLFDGERYMDGEGDWVWSSLARCIYLGLGTFRTAALDSGTTAPRSRSSSRPSFNPQPSTFNSPPSTLNPQPSTLACSGRPLCSRSSSYPKRLESRRGCLRCWPLPQRIWLSSSLPFMFGSFSPTMRSWRCAARCMALICS